MQLLAVILVLILASLAHCRPTFDKIAHAFLDALDDQPTYYSPGRPLPGGGYPRPYPGPGPLIQEGYEQGYDYHYGGGHAYGGYQQTHPAGYGYYPPPRPVHPPTAYYPPPQPGSYSQPTVPSTAYYPHKSPDPYGGGYKQRGY